jgi:hypothetical protein
MHLHLGQFRRAGAELHRTVYPASSLAVSVLELASPSSTGPSAPSGALHTELAGAIAEAPPVEAYSPSCRCLTEQPRHLLGAAPLRPSSTSPHRFRATIAGLRSTEAVAFFLAGSRAVSSLSTQVLLRHIRPVPRSCLSGAPPRRLHSPTGEAPSLALPLPLPAATFFVRAQRRPWRTRAPALKRGRRRKI